MLLNRWQNSLKRFIIQYFVTPDDTLRMYKSLCSMQVHLKHMQYKEFYNDPYHLSLHPYLLWNKIDTTQYIH